MQDGQRVATMEARNVRCLAASKNGAGGTWYGEVFVRDAETYKTVWKDVNTDTVSFLSTTVTETPTRLETRHPGAFHSHDPQWQTNTKIGAPRTVPLFWRTNRNSQLG